MSSSEFNLWPILESVLTWFRQKPELEKDSTEEIAKGWQFIISEAEEKILKHQQDCIRKTQNELTVLRRISTSVTWRPKIIQYVLSLYSENKNDIKQLHESKLSSSERLSCLRKVFDKHEKNWLQVLKQLSRHSNLINQLSKTDQSPETTENKNRQLDSCWYEQSYSKGVLGEIRTLAHQATYPAETSGLTYRICSDIIWIVYLSLSRELVSNIDRMLNSFENQKLFELIILMGSDIIKEWKLFSEIKGSYEKRSGILPGLWSLEEEKNQIKLNEIKNKGVDAKFSDGFKSCNYTFDFQTSSNQLKSKLKFRGVKSEEEKIEKEIHINVKTDNIRTRAKNLEKILFLK